jgi:hypothetical protein
MIEFSNAGLHPLFKTEQATSPHIASDWCDLQCTAGKSFDEKNKKQDQIYDDPNNL